MPDLGDVAVGPADIRALGATVTNIGGQAPAPWSAHRAAGPVRVSDASHACGLDDLNAGVGQQVPPGRFRLLGAWWRPPGHRELVWPPGERRDRRLDKRERRG